MTPIEELRSLSFFTGDDHTSRVVALEDAERVLAQRPTIPECCYGGKLNKTCVEKCSHIAKYLWPVFDALQTAQPSARPTSEVDPFNCPKCGAHDYGLSSGKCLHCGYIDHNLSPENMARIEATYQQLRAEAGLAPRQEEPTLTKLSIDSDMTINGVLVKAGTVFYHGPEEPTPPKEPGERE